MGTFLMSYKGTFSKSRDTLNLRVSYPLSDDRGAARQSLALHSRCEQ